VADLLDQIQTRLDSKKVESGHRREILDQVLPYIESGNAGMDDMLYEVAYAACYDDADLRGLAKAFEAMQGDWKVANARSIYRRLGDRAKYFELRAGRMDYGADYHDLATFYWEAGEKEKALQVAEEGLRKGQGRMDELRRFVADRAEESGDREKFLALQFDQATDGLTLQKYKAFKKMCNKAEWERIEPRVLACIKDAWQTEQLKIRMHRKEYDEAMVILAEERYPTSIWDDGDEIRIAQKLEKRYPEQILKYYLSGLGNLTVNATRKEYTRKAGVMAKVRRLLVEVLGDEARWKKFAAKVRQDNIRRPAFQQEFAKVLPGWRELN
jgi:tetratricopeptide (TPR) repeat protein